MKVVIVEDEKPAADNLEKLLRKVESGVEVVARLASVRKSVEWFSSNQADLVLMDIELGDGQSFQIFEQVNLATPVIFTTAYDQYAIRAFRSNGIDYLLKPIDEEELARALRKYKNFAAPGVSLDVLRNWMTGLKTEKEYKKRFLVQAGSRIRTIPVGDIAYFFFLGGDTYFCTGDNRRFPAEQSLDRLEELLHPDSFFRINRKMIVSFGCIDKIFTMSRSRIKLVLNPPFEEEVLVSFNKAPEFRSWLNR